MVHMSEDKTRPARALLSRRSTIQHNSDGDFRNFLRRHSRILTVLGALIVFVTFVVKEGLRDRGKDLLASVESAQTTFVMRSDVEDLRLQLRSLQRSIRTTGGESMEVERYNTIAQAQFWVQHGLSASLDNT